MKRVIIWGLFFGLFFFNFCFAQTSASQMQRAEELIEKEEALRKELKEPKKVFVKNIIVEGVTLLSEDEIKEITAPFIKHWLNAENFEQIKELIKQSYQEKGYTNKPAEISHRIKKKSLIIEVKE